MSSLNSSAWAVLAELLIDLSDSGSSRNKEESASLLAILVATSPRFVAPYAEPLLHILVPQIRNALPISLRLRLLAMRNASLQKSAAKLGGADFFDCQKASLTTALLTSQSAAHAAAQTVQAVATATARAGGAPGSGGSTDKAAGTTTSTAIRGGGNAGGANQQLFGARAIAAANHAATTASIAAKVVAAAVGRQGLNFGGPATMLLDDFEKFNSHLGFASPPRVISNLDLLIGDPNESLPGTNQDFLSVAAELDLTNLTNALSSMSECLDDTHALASKGLFCAPKAGQPEGSAIAMWREPTPVVVALFSVLGHLSGVCPAAVVPLMDDLLPILTCMLQDSTCHAKRSIAAWTLSVMITNTGFVVLPYLKHPDLLDLLFGLLKREESKNIQAEIVRLLGLIGAVDPFKLKMCAGQMDSLQDTGVAVSMHDTVESRENRWTRAVNGGNAVHAVYVDFKKAFDSVPHQRLLHKLSRTGIRGKLLRWIQSFLIGRSQIVHVGGRQSAEVAVESGVPQGSVLGPTLFIVYVNDCVSELNCDVAMFADDVKLWSVIRTEFDEERLQADLTRLEKWSQDWLLPFNVAKCNVLRVGRTRSLSRRVYHLNGVPLQEVDAQKDLATTTNLRGHPLKLRVTGAKLDIRKFFFSNRVIEAWNALPTDVVMSTSVEAFKRKLD
ncbi:hypothetical protein SprV_0100499200 [Sparganum proliferum]